MSGPAPLVRAEALEVRYHGGPEPAVRDLDFTLGPGDGLLISGPAGSGKTSALRGLLGLVEHGGTVRVLGAGVGAPAGRGRVGYGPQGPSFSEGLTVRETVAGVAALRAGPADADAAIARAGLQYVARWRTARLDAEGARRLSLAVAIVGDPDVVVLDDPWLLADTVREIAAARGRGAAVIAAGRDPGGLGPALGRRIALREGSPR